MASKIYELPEIGVVHFYKRKSSKSIRLSVTQEGTVRVSLPNWVSYRNAVSFVASKRGWIEKQLSSKKTSPLVSGSRIGKAHQLVMEPDISLNRITTRILANEVRISYPAALSERHDHVQMAIKKASLKALKQQASKLLPIRVSYLAAKHGYTYNAVKVKQLKSRWGSCDINGNITLSIFLMQLPWEMIDYVIIHELVHTREMNHSTNFWLEFEKSLPDAKSLKRQMRQFQTILAGAS